MQQMEPAKFYQEYIATNLIKPVPIQIKISNNRYDYLYNGAVKMTTGYYVSQDNSYTSSTVYKIY